jgi:nucleoside-diphosphate-sugar epimerase
MRSWTDAFRGRRVLITGGLGLIGSNLAHALVRLKARVTIVDALLPMYGGNMHNIAEIINRVTLHRGDVRDEEAMGRLVRDKDFVFHLAAQVSYLDSVTDPFLDLDVNCRGQLVLLEACRRFNCGTKVLFAGSRLQFGATSSNPVDEEHPQRPVLPYAIHKLAAERYLQMYHQLFDLRTVVLRLANPYGPRQQMKHSRYGIVNWFIRQAMEGRVITVFGDGRQQRDYVYVDDVVRAFLMAAASERSVGEIFNVGSGQGCAFAEMAATVVRTVGSGRVEFVAWPDHYRSTDTGDYVTDIGKISRLLGWRPRVGIAEGIARTHRFYVRRAAHYWSEEPRPTCDAVAAAPVREATPW